MDRIYIRDLTAHCIVGTEPRERVVLQSVIVSIALDCDLSAAAASDRLDDTVNYVTLKNDVVTLIQGSAFHLIETLADRVAALCLRDPRVQSAEVTVDKPGALTGARSVAVSLKRSRR